MCGTRLTGRGAPVNDGPVPPSIDRLTGRLLVATPTLEDPNFRRALRNTLLFTIASQAIVLLCAGLIAHALTRPIRGKWLLRFLSDPSLSGYAEGQDLGKGTPRPSGPGGAGGAGATRRELPGRDHRTMT